MIISIIAIVASFAWLLKETQCLTLRLPYGKASVSTVMPEVAETLKAETSTLKVYKCAGGLSERECFNPAIWRNSCGVECCDFHKNLMTAFTWESRKTITWALIPDAMPYNPDVQLLTGQCYVSKVHEIMGERARDDNKIKTSYQQVKFDNQTITLSATSPKLYELWNDAVKAQDIKRAGGFAQAPCKQIPMFIEEVRTGSHVETMTTEYINPATNKPNTWNKTVTDYKKVYSDCLVPKEWLKEHEHDLDGHEPTIDITVSGQAFSVNGNYKKGMIKDFMLQHSKRMRVGRKMQTVFEDAQIVDMGGGVKIVTYPETVKEDELARATV